MILSARWDRMAFDFERTYESIGRWEHGGGAQATVLIRGGHLCPTSTRDQPPNPLPSPSSAAPLASSDTDTHGREGETPSPQCRPTKMLWEKSAVRCSSLGPSASYQLGHSLTCFHRINRSHEPATSDRDTVPFIGLLGKSLWNYSENGKDGFRKVAEINRLDSLKGSSITRAAFSIIEPAGNLLPPSLWRELISPEPREKRVAGELRNPSLSCRIPFTIPPICRARVNCTRNSRRYREVPHRQSPV